MPSPYYKRHFIEEYFYHIYNRGANKNDIFKDKQDYTTFTNILAYYLQFPTAKPLSEKLREKNVKNANKVPNLVKSSIVLSAYALIPNHFHLLIKQKDEPKDNNGITNLMRRISITYAMYFQNKYDHSGVLFQGKYKNIVVNTDKQLLTLSKYIHKNPLEILNKNTALSKYPHSSYPYYIGIKRPPPWLDISLVLDYFSSNKLQYKNFVEEKPTELNTIEKIILE